jgi:nitric oxide reductase subunit B
MWYARSPEVVHSVFMERMVWLRVPGDIVFAIGCVFLALFAFRLLRGGRRSEPVAALQPVKA